MQKMHIAFNDCQDTLVIDTDKDGFISTVSFENSEVYFDITENGVKTKTSWVKGKCDVILVYDENEDGKIDSINEAFCNARTSGFDELRNTIDFDYDNKIDGKDILFNRNNNFLYVKDKKDGK